MRLVFIISLFLCGLAQAQELSSTLKKGDLAYEGFDYEEAIFHYTRAKSDSLPYQRKLADSYWKLNKTEDAERIYAAIMVNEKKSAWDIFHYACILRENGKTSESEDWMQKFSRLKEGQDSRAVTYSFKKGHYTGLMEDKGQFVITPLESNSKQQDFGLVFYKDKVVFTSSRPRSTGVKRSYNRNGLPFLDIYEAEEEGNKLIEIKPLSKDVNGKYHEGPVTFNAAGDLMIFTRNRYDTIAEGVKVVLELWSSKLVDGKWQEPVSLPFNKPNYSFAHPSLSSDGKWLFFASNMPGGYGGVDIYKCEINPDGSYKEPINMGQKVNSEGNEMFPVIHPDNDLLFYSSDGKYGIGGLDIFAVEINSFYVSGRVRNLGAPLNSPKDDFFLTLDKDKKTGYFSSNREGGKGSDDIYKVNLVKSISFD